ncbi:MAG: trehalose-phosphatase [Caulobacterales bacterium 68-7]|nr:MAG: trehalose-phosphatase [Caulobacterales bacterium 68-7]
MPQASLFLDLDGTLVGFENDPAAVRAAPATLAVLAKAQARLHGRLAILSGRSIGSVDAVLGGRIVTVAGVHGLQRRLSWEAIEETPPHPAMDEVTDILAAFARTAAGLRVERKGQSVAIHFREAPRMGAAVVDLAERLAATEGLEVQHGVLVAEIRTPGPDKGSALRAFMRAAPFVGTRPIFMGDDLTDEAAFLAAAALGGTGVLVGPWRHTAAQGRLGDPDAVRAWIEQSLDVGVFDLAETEQRRA